MYTLLKNMKSLQIPLVSYVYDRRHTGGPRKMAGIDIRISYRGKSVHYSTGVRVLPREWRRGMVTGRPDARELNEALYLMRARVLRIVTEMAEAGCVSLRDIPARLRVLEHGGTTFLAFCRDRIAARTYGLSSATARRYGLFLRKLEEWGMMSLMSDIDDAHVVDFDLWLAATGMRENSRWYNYHRHLSAMIEDAIDAGHVRRNPYKHLHIGKGDEGGGIHKCLTADELHAIGTAAMPTPAIERVRDLFIFQAYTCMSYADLAVFDAAKLQDVGGGRLLYTGTRGKTGVPFSFLLLAPAVAVLDKYGGSLPVISNVNYNAYLKIVAQAAGIDRPLTTHWARHTGATLLLNAGVPMETVARILGHSSTRVTRSVYAKLLDDTVRRQMLEAEAALTGAHEKGSR